MASPPDWLEGLGGALLGVNKGLSVAMDPYKAYEGVRTQTIANDAGDVALRNAMLQQQHREQFPDFYGNEVAGKDALNRVALSKGNLDIYGQQQNLALQQYLADPEGAFQQGVQQAGLQPGTPEYANWLTEAMQMYNPQASVAANAAFKVPDLQQENLKKQAILSYAQAYANRYDKDAVASWAPDGTITITGSDGEEVKNINPDVVLRSASMGSAKDPAAPILAGVKTQADVQKANADLYRATLTGRETPAQMYQYNNSVRIAEQGIYNKARDAEMRLEKSSDYQQADDETRKEMQKEARENTKRALNNLQHTINQMRAMGKVAEFDTEVAAQAQAAAPPPGAGSTLNALPFGPRGGGAARAAGGGRGAGVANVLDAFGQFGQGAGGPTAPTSQSNLQPFINQLLQPGR